MTEFVSKIWLAFKGLLVRIHKSKVLNLLFLGIQHQDKFSTLTCGSGLPAVSSPLATALILAARDVPLACAAFTLPLDTMVISLLFSLSPC